MISKIVCIKQLRKPSTNQLFSHAPPDGKMSTFIYMNFTSRAIKCRYLNWQIAKQQETHTNKCESSDGLGMPLKPNNIHSTREFVHAENTVFREHASHTHFTKAMQSALFDA